MERIYSVSKTEIHPHETGTHLNVCDKRGFPVGEINATRKKKVDSLTLKEVMKSLLKEGESFQTLVDKAARILPEYTIALDIRFIF